MKGMLLCRATPFGRTAWKPLLFAFVGLMGWAGTSNAQTAGQGYLAVGAGDAWEIGGGGEVLIQSRFGVGGDVRLISGAAMLLSINGNLHFPKSGSRIGTIPFVSGGYTRIAPVEFGPRNAFNVGGGLTYWFTDRKGVLVEVRDVVYRGVGTDQIWVARVGIAFR